MTPRIAYPEGTVRTRETILDGQPIHLGTNGAAYVWVPCQNCGGSGRYPSSMEPAGMCRYYCWRDRSPATYGRLPVLADYYVKCAQAADRKAYRDRLKWEAEAPAREAAAREHAEREAQRAAEQAARDASRAAELATRRHLGTVGERMTITVTVERVIYIKGTGGYGWQAQGRYVIAFRDDEGNAITCFASSKPGIWHGEQYGQSFESFDVGDRVTMKATVANHGEYKGEKQTTVQRIKVLWIEHLSDAASSVQGSR